MCVFNSIFLEKDGLYRTVLVKDWVRNPGLIAFGLMREVLGSGLKVRLEARLRSNRLIVLPQFEIYIDG